MSVAELEPINAGSLAELLERLGGIAPCRVRRAPAPGHATEADVIALAEGSRKRLCELIDGTLVEKAMGFRESRLAMYLGRLLDEFVFARNLGFVTGEQGMLRLWAGRVRIPDVAFFSWDRLPGRRLPDDPIPLVAPDLAVEVLSVSNTPGEMRLKREDYFAADCRLVWEIDPRGRAAAVYTGPAAVTHLTTADALDGGAVLPGFTLPLADLFADLDRRG